MLVLLSEPDRSPTGRSAAGSIDWRRLFNPRPVKSSTSVDHLNTKRSRRKSSVDSSFSASPTHSPLKHAVSCGYGCDVVFDAEGNSASTDGSTAAARRRVQRRSR